MRRTVALLVLLAGLIFTASASALEPAPTLHGEGAKLRWTVVTGATEYRDGYKPKGEGEAMPPSRGAFFHVIKTSETTQCGEGNKELCAEPWTPESFTEGAIYEVDIQAYKAHESAWSNVVEVTPHPASSEAEAGKIKVRLNVGGGSNGLAFKERYEHEGKTHQQIDEWIVNESGASIIKGYFPSQKALYPKSIEHITTLAYEDPSQNLECGCTAPLNAEQALKGAERALTDKSEGAKGVWLDDMNWHCSNRDHNQTSCSNEAEAEAEAEAKGDLELIKDIRAKWPEAIIEFNTQWSSDWRKWSKGEGPTAINADMTEALKESDLVTKEFGELNTFTTLGEYENLIAFFKEVHTNATYNAKHAKGIENLSEVTVPKMEYNLAGYFLVSNGRDYQGSDQPCSPSCATSTEEGNYPVWKGFRVSFGSPVKAKDELERGPKGYIRPFKAGAGRTEYDLANPPEGAEPWTRTFPESLTSTEYGTVTEVKLPREHGAVLHG